MSACRVAVFAGMLCVWMASQVRAQSDDLTLQGGSPTITFDDNAAPLQTWKIYADDYDFSIEDSNAITYPFRISLGSPHDSLSIQTNGVGIGGPPAFPLHVRRFVDDIHRVAQFEQPRAGKPTTIGVYNSAPVSNVNTSGYEFLLNDTVGLTTAARVICSLPVTSRANAQSALLFQTRNGGDFATAMRFQGSRVSIGTNSSTHLLRVANAYCNGNTWTNASSRTLKHDIAELSPAVAREAVMALQPVTYAYNSEPGDPQVGFIAEDVPALVATPDRQGLSSLEVVAALTMVVQEQERENATQRRQMEDQAAVIEALRAQNAAILKRVAALESRP